MNLGQFNFDTADLAVAGLSDLLACFSYLAAMRQLGLSAASHVSEWRRDVRTWASEAIDVLARYSEGDPPADSADAPDEVENDTSRHLSALIDQGRLLLPNFEQDQVSTSKPRAYQGLRHQALDSLVAAHQILEGKLRLHQFPSVNAALFGLRREFVSSIQSTIDPSGANRRMKKLLMKHNREYRSDPGGGQLPNDGIPPPGAEQVLRIAEQRYLLRRAK